jgi:hypothetical protein
MYQQQQMCQEHRDFVKPFHMYSAMEHSCLETTGWMAAKRCYHDFSMKFVTHISYLTPNLFIKYRQQMRKTKVRQLF